MADCADVGLGYLDRSNFLAGCGGHDAGGAPGVVSFLKTASISISLFLVLPLHSGENPQLWLGGGCARLRHLLEGDALGPREVGQLQRVLGIPDGGGSL